MACTNDKRRLQRDAKPVENTLIDGLTFVLAPKNRSHVLKTIMEHLKISDSSLAEEGYTALLRDFEPKPYPSIEGLRNLQRLMQLQNARLANIKPEELIDTSLIRKLDESGFIDQLNRSYKER